MYLTSRQIVSKLIIDTGPLFDFLLVTYWLTFHNKFLKKLRYIENQEHYKIIKGYIEIVRSIFITPYVVVEINYQFRKEYPNDGIAIEGFWKIFLEFFNNFNVCEESIRVNEMEYRELVKFGPTDASLFSLSKKIKAHILTGDSKLWKHCKDSILIWELY